MRHGRAGSAAAAQEIESTIRQLGKRVKGTEKHGALPGVDNTLHVIADDGVSQSDWKRCPLAPQAAQEMTCTRPT